MIYVNNTFCRTTGYAKHEASGRNCRFLQGPKTEPEGSPEADEAGRAKSRDRDVGKKQKIRLLLPLLRAGGLLPPTSADLALPARPVCPAPSQQHKQDGDSDPPRDSGRWSAQETARYEEALGKCAPSVKRAGLPWCSAGC